MYFLLLLKSCSRLDVLQMFRKYRSLHMNAAIKRPMVSYFGTLLGLISQHSDTINASMASRAQQISVAILPTDSKAGRSGCCVPGHLTFLTCPLEYQALALLLAELFSQIFWQSVQAMTPTDHAPAQPQHGIMREGFLARCAHRDPLLVRFMSCCLK